MANLDSTKVTSLLSWYHLNVNGVKEDWTMQDKVTCTPLLTTCDIGWVLKEISKSVCERTPAKRTGKTSIAQEHHQLSVCTHTSGGTRNTPSWPKCNGKMLHYTHIHPSYTHSCATYLTHPQLALHAPLCSHANT